MTTRTIWTLPNVALTLMTAMMLVIAGCSVTLSQDAAQCQTDSDCEKFGGHPYCQGGLCVASGLGPANCFFGTPTTSAQFLNQCTTAVCADFDDCERLGLCDGGGADAALLPPVATTTATDDAGFTLHDDPPCFSDDAGRPFDAAVVMTGTSNFVDTLSIVAQTLTANTGYFAVYQSSSSCTGVADIFGTGATNVFDPTSSSGKYASYYQPDGGPVECLLGDSGAPIHVTVSDVFSTTCANGGPTPSNVAEWLGPIQAMLFAVPANSSQSAITAGAARVVFGMGGDNGRASPWTDPTKYYVRSATAGTQLMIGQAINVPASSFWGVPESTATAVGDMLKDATNGGATADVNSLIGILSADVYQTFYPNLKSLAFRDDGQDCAYLPDSSSLVFDKANVRDGHYPIWGPIHYFAQMTDSTGDLLAPAAAWAATVAPAKISSQLIGSLSAAGLVPDCAMQVTRTTELGALASYSPADQCNCYFLSNATGVVPSSCTACTMSAQCKDPALPVCSYGYCEAR